MDQSMGPVYCSECAHYCAVPGVSPYYVCHGYGSKVVPATYESREYSVLLDADPEKLNKDNDCDHYKPLIKQEGNGGEKSTRFNYGVLAGLCVVWVLIALALYEADKQTMMRVRVRIEENKSAVTEVDGE